MQNYTAVTLERVNGKIMKRVRFYNRHGVCTRSKLVPYSTECKDWTKIPTSRRFRVYGDKCNVARGAVVEAFLTRSPLPQDNTPVYVNHTAKRDWLIRGGFIRDEPGRVLTWIPGDGVAAISDIIDEETRTYPTRFIECPDDATEDESICITGGRFEVIYA